MSLNIKLKHGYHITADKYEYQLSKTVNGKNKKGEPIKAETNTTHHPTINHALKWYIRQIPIESEEEITSMKDYLDLIMKVEKEVEELTRGH